MYTLKNGVEIPAVGFGTYKAADGKKRGSAEDGHRCGIPLF